MSHFLIFSHLWLLYPPVCNVSITPFPDTSPPHILHLTTPKHPLDPNVNIPSSFTSLSCSFSLHNSLFLCHINYFTLLIFKISFIYFWREGKEGRKRGRETKMCGCFSCGPHWGPGWHPGMCPDWELNQ